MTLQNYMTKFHRDNSKSWK